VSYCLQALQLFAGMDQQRFLAVLSEVAAVGQGGLQINEVGTSRTLKTLPGSWSDLALACLIHVGMKRLTPNEDSGLGIGAEYEEAVRLHGGMALPGAAASSDLQVRKDAGTALIPVVSVVSMAP